MLTKEISTILLLLQQVIDFQIIKPQVCVTILRLLFFSKVKAHVDFFLHRRKLDIAVLHCVLLLRPQG